jgi:hypothetical protein
MLAGELGPEFRLNRTTTGDQVGNQLDSDALGNYVAVWHGPNASGYGTNDVFFQRYNAVGTPLGPETQVNPDWLGEQDTPDVAVAASGSFVVVYQAADASFDGIYLRRYDAAGVPLGGAVLVNTFTTGDQQGSAVAIDDSGNVIVTWHSQGQDGSGWGVYAQRYNASGAPVGDEFRVNTYAPGFHSSPDVAIDADGDFVVVELGQRNFRNYSRIGERP